MLVELIVTLGVGGLALLLGWLIWKKERISLLHSYHYKNVAEGDRKPYTAKMGKALLAIGAGCVLTGITNAVFFTQLGWVFFAVGFAVGMVMMALAQKKYNGGFF